MQYCSTAIPRGPNCMTCPFAWSCFYPKEHLFSHGLQLCGTNCKTLLDNKCFSHSNRSFMILTLSAGLKTLTWLIRIVQIDQQHQFKKKKNICKQCSVVIFWTSGHEQDILQLWKLDDSDLATAQSGDMIDVIVWNNVFIVCVVYIYLHENCFH